MKIHAHTVCPKMVHFSIGNICVHLGYTATPNTSLDRCVVLSVIITIIRSVIKTQWLFAQLGQFLTALSMYGPR